MKNQYRGRKRRRGVCESGGDTPVHTMVIYKVSS